MEDNMENFNAFLEEFEKELTCSICNEIFTDPVTLPCLHSFCLKCMEQRCEKGNTTDVSCPYPACRSPFKLPDGDASKLCSSFYLKSLLKLLQIIGNKSKWEEQEIQQCTSCEKASKLVAFCQQCRGLICIECVKAHEMMKVIASEHKIIMLNEIMREHVEDFVSNLVFCEEQSHDKNKLEYFCFEEICRKYICVKCAVEDHNNHKILSVDKATDQVKQDIQQNMNRVNDLKKTYDEELLLSKQNMTRIQSEVDLAKRQVHDAVEAVIKKARDHEDAMIKALDEFLREQQEANRGEQSDVNTGINYLSEFDIHCQSLLNRNRKYEVLDVQDILKDKCEVSLQKSSILSRKPIQRNVRLRYVSNELEIENIGEIVETLTDPSNCIIKSFKGIRCGFENEFEILTKNSERELCDTNIESIDVKIKDSEGKELQKKVLSKRKGMYLVRYKAEKVGPCTITVSIGDEPIKNSPQNVNTFDINSDFTYVRSFGQEGEGKGQFKYPLSIALSESGEIAIGDRKRHGIQIFDTGGQYIREIECGEQKDGEHFQPEAVMFFEGKLIVTGMSAGNGQILEIDSTGKHVKTLYGPEEGFRPRGMCVTENNNIAVCYDRTEKRGFKSGIKLFNKEGHLVREFYIPEKSAVPWYVAYGNSKYFVSYYSEHCIRVFDSNGVFLHKFGEEGTEKDGQFNKVGGLFFYGPASIIVNDVLNNRVQLLTQEGKFIKSFGKGSMFYPIDLAVTLDGRLFVLNFGSHNVQVWR